MTSETRNKQTLTSVNRAIDVLEAFTDQHPRWGLSPLARHLGIGKATLHRLLRNLEDRGYLTQDSETKLYQLGLRPLRIAQAALASTPSEIAMPYLSQAAEELGEQMTLWVLDGSEAVCIARVAGTNPLRTHISIGAREPAQTLASGRCLLAFISEDELPADVDRASLQPIREQGVAVGNHRWPEVQAVAAPVRNHRGEVIAAMSVSGPAYRFEDDQLPKARSVVLAAAARASRDLGYDEFSQRRKSSTEGT